jgi:glycosyltransferase involved in cell wall biosynthesis
MSMQARWEKLHVHRAHIVITISEYCAGRLRELYGFKGQIRVVPEMIDLAVWRERLLQNAAPPGDGRFTVLCVCRFYPRKRVHLLLQAAEILRGRIPELNVRIAGGGPETRRLRQIWRERRLESVVTWIEDPSEKELAHEYNRADVFCLASVQEGFGIVLLEAMAAGKPIVAARAAAIPEVVRNGILVEPDHAESLAEGIEKLYSDTELRRSLAMRGASDVERFDSPRVTSAFLREIEIAV